MHKTTFERNPRVASRGLKWENKTYKLKRFITKEGKKTTNHMTNLIKSQYEQKRQCLGRQSGRLIISYEDSVFTKKKIKASRF